MTIMFCVKTGYVAFVTELSTKILTNGIIAFYLNLLGGSERKYDVSFRIQTQNKMFQKLSFNPSVIHIIVLLSTI